MNKPRVKTRTIFEGVAFRDVVDPEEGTTTIEAFMCKNQTGGDPVFANLLTVPRRLYFQGEHDSEVAQRLNEEFGAQISRIEYASLALDERLHATPPETLFSRIFIVYFAAHPLVDAQHRWYRVDNLPPTTTDLHRNSIVPRALAVYKNNTLKKIDP